MKTALILSSLLLVAGCANSFGKVRQSMDTAPEWYGEARKEIIGEGYPNLSDAPQLVTTEVSQTVADLALSREETEAVRAMFASNPRASVPNVTTAEMVSFRQQNQAKFSAITGLRADGSWTPFLSASEIAALRAKFPSSRRR